MTDLILDISSLADKTELHAQVRGALDLPEWYGANLDALYDVLTEAGETRVLLIGAKDEPEWFRRARTVFMDAAKENRRLHLTLREHLDIPSLLQAMTPEEKCAYVSGADDWNTKAIPRLGLPAAMMADGPHGLRKVVNRETQESEPSVCFPPAVNLAAAFDPELCAQVGGAIAQICQSAGVGMILGPAVNIKRTPLCGRNFEYFSEDPYLSGKSAAGMIRGTQAQGVGCCLKHFCLNNQETRRMTISAEADERTMREIYLKPFEIAVREGRPWSVMCAYNRVNGTYMSENGPLLTDVLRHAMGFDGMTVTDWGAVKDRIAGVKAGLDLEMPAARNGNAEKLLAAMENGALDPADLDRAVEHILCWVDRTVTRHFDGTEPDVDALRAMARKAARESMVLLKNEGSVLPLEKSRRTAFIGAFAKHPRCQGGGSSRVNAEFVLSALDAAKDTADVAYAEGFRLDGQPDESLIDEACALAARCEQAVLFLGLSDREESEGYDRTSACLPSNQIDLLKAVLQVRRHVAVVLVNGSPVSMPWIDSVPAVLEAYLGGEMAGGAIADLLFGDCNPCGKLPETFPLRLSDTPSFLYGAGGTGKVRYREGVFVGYRYYDKKEMPVLFPFGHGLSYSEFQYGILRLSGTKLHAGDALSLSFDLTNTGSRAGAEVAQVYIESLETEAVRPPKELKAFRKVYLEPGERRTVQIDLDPDAFAYWNEEAGGWHIPDGAYRVLVGSSSRDIRSSARVYFEGVQPLPLRIHEDTTIGDLLRHPATRKKTLALLAQANLGRLGIGIDGSPSNDMAEAVLNDLPLHAVSVFAAGKDLPTTEEIIRWLSE